MEKILITGGAGFIGSDIAGALIKEGYEVVAYDNLSTGYKKNISEYEGEENFCFVKGDILDFSNLLKEMANVDYVLHHAALSSVSKSVADPLTTNRINVEGTLNTLIAAKESGVKKVVVASSTAVYGNSNELPKHENMRCNPLSPYAVSKIANEIYAELASILYNLPTLSLRYFNVYGPKQDPNGEYAAVIPKFIKAASEGRPLNIYGDGAQTRDFVYVDDVVRANLQAMKSKAQGNFNIASGSKISIAELAKRIIELTNSNSKIVYREPRAGDILHSFADISKAREDMGYKPNVSLDEGLSKTVEWYRSEFFK